MLIFPFLPFRYMWNHICKDKGEVFSFSAFNNLLFYLNWKLHLISVFLFFPVFTVGASAETGGVREGDV